MAKILIESLYIGVVVVLSLYGFLGFVTLALFWRHKDGANSTPEIESTQLPPVTVQIPIYNERFVIEKIIDAVAALEYPRDRLQIQVVDDSDDETVEVARARVQHYQSLGYDIEHVRRIGRQGYKAGALDNALDSANGQHIAIFDADFQPAKDYLQKTIPYFVDDPQLGMIQARWGHLNSRQSTITAAQSIALDKHFRMEQKVRHEANMFPKFNGSAGIWRRECIEDAGGWKDDTLCEDLCLSTRATLQGWTFRYLDDLVVPAELPVSIQAYKNQQARWAKGATQCLRLYGASILTDRNQSLLGRFYALLSMSAYGTYLLFLVLLLLQLPIIFLGVDLPPLFFLFTIIGLGQPLLFILAQFVTYEDWYKRLFHFPTLLLLAVGTAPTNAEATLQGLFGKRKVPFVRTPKGPSQFPGSPGSYRTPNDGMLWMELALTIYTLITLIGAIFYGQFGLVVFLLTSFLGFGYVSLLEIREGILNQQSYRIYLTDQT